MRFMQTESVLQTKNRSRPAKNRFSVALITVMILSFGTGRPGQTVQTAPRSGSTLFAISSASFGRITPPCSTFRLITANFRVSEFLGVLQYIIVEQKMQMEWYVM